MSRHFLAIIPVVCVLASCADGVAVNQGDGTASSTFEGNVKYDDYFCPERLRLDFVFGGDKDNQYAFLTELHKESLWAGSPIALIDRFGYGQYFLEAFYGEKLIFSKGFCALFDEWRTTEEAKDTPMAQTQTVWMPFPKDTVHVVLYQRMRATGKFKSMFQCDVDPSDNHIIPGPDNDYQLTALMENGGHADKVDLVFSGEGYTKEELPKLREDATRFMEYLFSMEPYAHRRADFNIYLVESWSNESGVDIPNRGQWRNTAMDSSFDTFYSDRYLTILDHRKIASVYSGAPFDALFVIANETKYGGGGIYNSYAMGTSDNKYSNEVFIHEFGHSFAGLGDEYYDSSTSYEDYYPRDIEPWEPNITTFVDFASKWEDMINEGTPVPTPNDPDKYYGVVGAFEGGGYMAEGCWRPYFECRMLNNTAPCFCPVCQRAIEKMIDHYVK